MFLLKKFLNIFIQVWRLSFVYFFGVDKIQNKKFYFKVNLKCNVLCIKRKQRFPLAGCKTGFSFPPPF